MSVVVSQRGLGALLTWFNAQDKKGSSVMLHPLCCDELKCMLIALQCKLYYVDIDPVNLCASKNSVKKILKIHNIDIFINVRTFGFEGDLTSLFKFVKFHGENIEIIDDKCLCRPRLPVEPFDIQEYADVELYSTGYSKYLDIGYGGFLISKNDFDINRGVGFTQQGYELSAGSLKSNSLEWIDDRPISAEGYLDIILEKIENVDSDKKNKNEIYFNMLKNDNIKILNHHTSWRFQIVSTDRDRIKKAIFNQGFFCSSHYQSNTIGSLSHEKLDVAKYFSENILNLFNDFRVTELDIKKVCNLINCLK